MTAKKKPRTGGDGASSNSLHGDDGSWGELSITAILRPGREHRKTTGAGGTGLSPTRFADCGVRNAFTALLAIGHRGATTGGLFPPAEAPRFAPDYDAIMSGLGSWRRSRVPAPRTIKAPVE